MNLRYISLLLLLVFVAGIGAISAEDISDMGEMSSDEVADEVISVDDSVTDVSTSDADEVTSDVEPTRSTAYTWGDFKSEVEDTSVNTVKLNQSNIAPSSDSSDQISINHDITIVGGYGYYIGNADWNSAASYDYIPMITSENNLNVNFENVTFQYLSNNIFIKLMGNGNYAFKNCVFNNINCTGDHQSVIWLNYGYALIENCTFTNVTSSFGAVTNYYTSWGTAVNNARMTVRDSTFKDNYATTEPGAINNCGKLEVYDSTFENNEAYWWAGAIHTHSNANTTIVRSNFRNNIARWNGGALYSYSYLTVINSTFTANEAHQTSGGAIAASAYGSRPTVVIENCDFDDNYAVGSGGAIQFGGTSLTVNYSRFNNNNASGGTGGAISSGGTTVNVNNSNFTNNTASARGGAVYASGAGYLNVYSSNFVNNTGSEGNDIAYYYTTKKANAAFLTYDYDEFWGANNSSGSIYAYNTQYLVVNAGTHNIFHDISEYVDPSGANDTNTSGDIIVPDSFDGVQLWNASLSGALGGTPLVVGDRIYVPNGHSIYCLNITNGNLLWNVSSTYVDSFEWNNFHDLALHNGVLVAPCDGDKLYFFNATNGNQIQSTSNIIQGSSLYAPLVVGNNIYISSEYGYGVNNESWIAVINYNNGVYSYASSILNIPGVSYGTHALISAPILWNNYLWVNTINGLVRYDLATNTYITPVANAVGKPVVGGDYLYVLTTDNHICGVNASGNVVKNITVGGDVGSTLAINGDNTIVYTVDANGNIYYADINSNSASFIRQVNTVSSALAVDSNGYLYVGDDAGILWTINVYYDESNEEWIINTVWAYNASSAIYGTPVINDGVAYIGTIDTFYAITGPSRGLLSPKSLCMKNNQLNLDSDVLGSVQNEILADVQEVYLDPKTLVHSDFRNDANGGNTIYYLNEGTYDVNVLNIGGKKSSSGQKTYYNNIIIKPNGNANVVLKINGNPSASSQQGITFTVGDNITFENLKIISSPTSSTYNYFLGFTAGVKNVYIKNCTFENMSNINSDPNYGEFIFIKQTDDDIITNIHIENCRFVNCNASYLIRSYTWYGVVEAGSIYISNCSFENSFGAKDSLSFGYAKEVYLENNSFDSSSKGNIIIESTSKIYSNVYFNVLTESLKLGEEGNIVAELVDDNGNRIYPAVVTRQGLDNFYTTYLNFTINHNDYTPTFDRTTGLYTLKYTPSNVGEISVSVNCPSVEMLNDDNDPILVKAITDLVVNCNDDGVYGAEFKVNATLDSTITGENITFTVLNSTNNPVKSVNTIITDGFASYSFTDLPVGEYIVVADYAGGTSFASATNNKTFTITQADSTVEIVVLNDIIHVGDKINVKAVVPTGATGNVTFRLENSKTVNVSEVATFDGLSAGNYTIFAIYNGDANYKASKEVNVTINVVKYDLNLKISADNITYGEALVVKLSTNSNFTGGIYVYIGELKQAAQIICGVGNATFTNLTAADYFITANFTGDDSFYQDSANTTATVNGVEVPADKAISTNVPANTKSPTFSIKLDKDATGTFTVNIDNGKIVKTAELKDGAASITVADLAAGGHTISVSYSGDGKYAPITQNTTLTIKEPAKPASKVTKKATKIVAKKKTFKAKVKVKKYTITLKSGKTLLKKVKVTLKVKGKTYKATTNKKGKATFKIKNLKKKGTYKAVIKFKGNKNYKATSKKVKIKVKK